MTFQSGEFPVDALRAPAASPACAIFDGTIFVMRTVFYDFNYSMMYQTTFDLNNLMPTDNASGKEPINVKALKDIGSWQSTYPDNLPPTKSTPGLAAMTTLMCAVINPTASLRSPALPYPASLIASTYSRPKNPSETTTWSQPISLFESDGKTIPKPYEKADVSATAIGENIVLVTCGRATSASQAVAGTYVGVYDVRHIDRDNNKWPAESHHYLMGNSDLPEKEDLVRVATEWYSTVGTWGQGIELNLFVVQWTSKILPGHNVPYNSYWNIPMTVTEKDGVTAVTLSPTNFPSSEWPSPVPEEPDPLSFSPVTRDPGGRLRIWTRDNAPSKFLALRVQTARPLVGPPLGIVSTGEALLVKSTADTPTSLFYVFKEGRTETTEDGKTVLNYPVFEFVFYGPNLLSCQAVRCGTIQVIPGFSQPHLNQLPSEVNIIAGIIDGPIPLPIENYHGHDLGTDTYDAGSLTYGTTDTKVQEREVSNSWSLGLESSGEATAGVGPAWDVSFSGGMGYVSGDSTETSRAYSLGQGSSISFDKERSLAELDPAGSLRKVAAQFSITAFRYLDEFGPAVDSTTDAPADAPKPASVLTTMVDPGALDFMPYMFVPGELASYTPEAINTKMRSLGYKGDNYYGDVICKNAYPFGDPEKPYLSYTFSPATRSGEAFSQFKSSFRENSWHLDAKLYAGISGGANIFGVEEFEMKLLIGGEYQHESTTTENTKSEWGIELGLEGWILPEGKADASVTIYDFRVFFLPVPAPPSDLSKTHWTQELIGHMPGHSETKASAIDPNSGCWRITYAVTRIAYKNEEKHPTYQYDGSLDRSSVYQGDKPTE